MLDFKPKLSLLLWRVTLKELYRKPCLPHNELIRLDFARQKIKIMKPINEIYSDFLLSRVRFHRKIESDLFRDALMFYMDEKYITSATLCAVLYEMVFTTRLIRETSNPPDLISSKENLNEQLNNLQKKEEEIVNQKKMSFKTITAELLKLGLLQKQEKDEYDSFYTDIRNPVLHGLTFRLFEKFYNKKPNVFEADVNSFYVYKKAAEELINKIYDLMAVKSFLKK